MIAELLSYSRIALVLALVGLLGCGGSRTTVEDPADLVADLLTAQDADAELTMSGTMSASTAPAKIWFKGFFKGADSLRSNLTGPFSVPVGTLVATKEQFLFINTLEGVAYHGEPSLMAMSRALALPLSYEQLSAAFRGALPKAPQPQDFQNGSAVAERVGSQVIVRVSDPFGGYSFTFDSEKQRLLSYSQFPDTHLAGQDPEPTLEIRYDRHLPLEGNREYPREISVRTSDARVLVTIDKMAAEVPAGTKMWLEIPAGMERKSL